MYIIYCDNTYVCSSKDKEAYHDLTEHHEINRLPSMSDVPNNKQSATSVISDTYGEEETPFGYAVRN